MCQIKAIFLHQICKAKEAYQFEIENNIKPFTLKFDIISDYS